MAAVDEPFFAAAIDASKVLFNFMALRVANVLRPPQFRAAGVECFRPSATMLTSVETVPDATPVEIPPLDNRSGFEAAVRASHGKYIFSSDNEVLFFGDKQLANGYAVVSSVTEYDTDVKQRSH